MAEKRVTLEEVLAARTPRGGWTKKQLAEWGVDWPPTTGWVKRLTGDLNASVPMPGRTAVAMRLARKTRLELEQENLRLRAALELYRDAVRIDATMEGPKFMGANFSALKRAWDADRAALGGVNGY